MSETTSLLDQVEPTTGRLVFSPAPTGVGAFLERLPMSNLTDAELQILRDGFYPVPGDLMRRAAVELAHLRGLINNPHTEEFLSAVQYEASHQRYRFGEAHDRQKSAENWFWLIGRLVGKCLRAVITGNREKALHHTISSAAALANWYQAIKLDTSGCGEGLDLDLPSLETSEADAQDLPVGRLPLRAGVCDGH
ncbi:MAG: hypothetical protein ACT6S0_26850 [Roseateles sp.]|uniref:hypothetical protein n=1 Tax=Roseateles sp. TaxID=1971397 RepID=UPI0040372126